MSTTIHATLALAVSAAPLLRLALHDPKRLRSQRLKASAERRGTRRLLAALCLAPGVALALLGQWPAFLIWLGGVAAGGWLLVLWLARAQSARSPIFERDPRGRRNRRERLYRE